jgi:hypothetical protein
MTTTTTTADVLFDAEDPAVALQDAAAKTSLGLGPLTVSGVTVPETDVWSMVGSILDEPIVNIAMRGWSELDKVRTVKARTLEFPGTTEIVRPFKHTINSTQEPTVEISIGPVSADVLTFTVALSITIEAVDLTISGGEINEISAGRATASAALSIGETKLAERASRPVDLNLLRLGS